MKFLIDRRGCKRGNVVVSENTVGGQEKGVEGLEVGLNVRVGRGYRIRSPFQYRSAHHL